MVTLRRLVVPALLVAVPSLAASRADWRNVRTLEGEFAVVVRGATTDAKAKPLIQGSLDTFVLHGRFRLDPSPSPGSARLFKGKARGSLIMASRTKILDGAATSLQTCAGSFVDGEVTVELFLDEQEYQIAFEGSVPNGKTSIRYPLQEAMAQLFGSSSRLYARNDDATWQEFAALTAGAQKDFDEFAKGDTRTEEVTFSVTTVPEFRKTATGPVMRFLPLPADQTRISGSGPLQLIVSTAVMPTTITARTTWSIRGK